MANQEQINILKQGVEFWNNWRAENENIEIDLRSAFLEKANLSGVNFNKANLSKTNLKEADLSKANLSEADLSRSELWCADLAIANLTKANLRESDIRGAELMGANLTRVNLTGAWMGFTHFESTDLNDISGIEKVRHLMATSIDTHTIQICRGKIPESFLQGCGLPNWEIESTKLHNPDLTNEEIIRIQYRIYDLRATQALQISPLFISYSHADTIFVDQIDSALTQKGVRFWRDIHDAKAGRLETQIDLAIRQNPTVLLILSKNSLNSDWVQHEVRKARELEKELGRDALCPIALDDSWKSSNWPARIMEQVTEYNILDFSGWENKQTFESKFTKLLDGLNLFYKKPTT